MLQKKDKSCSIIDSWHNDIFICYRALLWTSTNLNLNQSTSNFLPRQGVIWPSLNPCTIRNPVLLIYSKTNKFKVMPMKYSPFCPWANELNPQVCQMKFTLMLNRISSDEWNHSPVSSTIKLVKSHKSHNASNRYATIHHFVTKMYTCDMHVCTFLLQSGALWNMELVYYGIYVTGW